MEKPLIKSLRCVLKSTRPRRHVLFARKLFEHSKIKKILGANLAVVSFFSIITPTNYSLRADGINITSNLEKISFETEQGTKYPVDNIKITQGYYIFHKGYDLDGETGDSVHPIMKGVVKTVENSRFGYGKSIVIDHGNKIESRYAHLSKIEVEEGQEVDNGTEIGLMGATGKVSGDHLHLEIYENGKNINPSQILPR